MPIIIQTLNESPVIKIVHAMTPEARIHISLRPLRSARLPQYGETIAWEINVAANAIPEYKLSSKREKFPSSLIKSEINGIVIEYPIPVTKQPSQSV